MSLAKRRNASFLFVVLRKQRSEGKGELDSRYKASEARLEMLQTVHLLLGEVPTQHLR